MELTVAIEKPRIIRAWFDTIINPIIEGLEQEEYYCSRGNWTWKYFSNTFEILVPLFAFIPARYQPNLEQFLSFVPELKSFEERHNHQLEQLRISCRSLFESLSASKTFIDLYRTAKEQSVQQAVPLTGPAGVVSEPESESDLQWVAQYVINNIESLDSYYSLRDLWNPNREKFRNVLQSDTVNHLYRATIENGHGFLKTVEESLAFMKELRSTLSLKSGEPIVVE